MHICCFDIEDASAVVMIFIHLPVLFEFLISHFCIYPICTTLDLGFGGDAAIPTEGVQLIGQAPVACNRR
jgi:hypothetical protein